VTWATRKNKSHNKAATQGGRKEGRNEGEGRRRQSFMTMPPLPTYAQ